MIPSEKPSKGYAKGYLATNRSDQGLRQALRHAQNMSIQTSTTRNPTTEEKIHEYQYLTETGALTRLRECHQTYLDWRSRPMEERVEIIKGIGEQLLEHKEELADLMSAEMGKLVFEGVQEIELCAQICDYTAKEGPSYLADETRTMANGKKAIITYRPQGVILGIQPWNFPAYQVIRYSVPNLLAGNTVLLKHAANVWGFAARLERLYREAGLPDGAFQSLNISHEVVEVLIRHRLIRGVTFTGSAKAGRKVAAIAGGALKKTVLELGSNDAYLVLEDADLTLAIGSCVNGRLNNSGQTCTAAKRFIVVDAVYDEFRDRFVEGMKNQILAPLAREDLREKLHTQVTESIHRGAVCLLGGVVPEGDGYFYPATILENVRPGMPAYSEELFGPVAALIRARDEEDAVRIANDSEFGLGGGIFSADEERAVEIARTGLDTGIVNINGYQLAQPNLPFGGVKDSGYGREHGGFGIREFVNIKTVMVG